MVTEMQKEFWFELAHAACKYYWPLHLQFVECWRDYYWWAGEYDWCVEQRRMGA